MSWTVILLVATGVYAQKAIAPAIVGAWTPTPRLASILHLLAVPVLAGLIVVQTVGDQRELVLDARLPALLVAAIAVWRGAPFLVTVLLAAAVAAGSRLVA